MAIQDENIPPLSHTAPLKVDRQSGSGAQTTTTTTTTTSGAGHAIGTGSTDHNTHIHGNVNALNSNAQYTNGQQQQQQQQQQLNTAPTTESILTGIHHIQQSDRLPFSNHSHSISNQEHFSATQNENINNNNNNSSYAHNNQSQNTSSRHLRAVSGVSMLSPFQTRRRVEVHDENEIENETVNESTTNNELYENENENESLTDLNNPIMVSDETRRMSLKRRPPTDLQDDNKRIRVEDSVLHSNTNSNTNSNSNSTCNTNPNTIVITSDSFDDRIDAVDETVAEDDINNVGIEGDTILHEIEEIHTPNTQTKRIESAHEERASSMQQLKYDDLDADDGDDPLMVSEYVEDIFKYLYETEAKMLPDPNYLQLRTELRPKMRSILVDWMVEVHLKFKLLPETLYLAINIMDRFLSKEVVQVDRLQLLATGSLFIAAKYEEVYSPSIKNYAYVTDGAFTEEEILGAEKFILEILNFNMSCPNPLNFLRRISKADDYNVHTRTIAKYLLEITYVDHRFIGYLPSLCAAAAMYIARKMIGKNDWNPNLIHYSGDYTKKHLAPVCEMIMDYLQSPVVHEEFFRKYASRRFLKVSILARTWARESVRNMSSIMD